MKWPTGKWNGERISGFKFSITINILRWRFVPRIGWNFAEPYFMWLPVTVRLYAEYEPNWS